MNKLFLLFYTLLLAGELVISQVSVANGCLDLIRKKDYYEARNICEKLANTHNFKAQFALSTLYYQGLGGMKNYSLALEWLTRSAQQNYPLAQYNLGTLIANGQDNEEGGLVMGVAWLMLARDNHYAEAEVVIEQIMQELTSEEKQQLKVQYQQLVEKIKQNKNKP